MKDHVFYTFANAIKASRQRNGRKLRRKARKLEKSVGQELGNHKDFILKKAKRLFGKKAQKNFESEIDIILEGIDDEDLIAVILASSAETMLFGAEYRIRKNSLAKIGIDFSLDHPLAKEYLESERPLLLAKMKQTTKDAVKPILIEALESGQSYNDTAKILSDSFAFSRSRAQMIAVNEIGHAYEYGNKIPIKDAVEKGYNATKKWLTAGDDRVTQSCADNEDEGWIRFDDSFSSGDTEAPRNDHPRCRCTTLYEIDN